MPKDGYIFESLLHKFMMTPKWIISSGDNRRCGVIKKLSVEGLNI